jgi:hypothetical protein
VEAGVPKRDWISPMASPSGPARSTPCFDVINETLAFVKEHCCAGFEKAAELGAGAERSRRRTKAA